MKTQYILTLIIAALTCTPVASDRAWASAPIKISEEVKKKKEALEKAENKIKEENKRKMELELLAKQIDQELYETKDKLLIVAQSVRQNENEMQLLEKRISELEEEKEELTENLLNDRIKLSKLILALERIRRLPPEAMMANPEAPYKTAQSAMLMADIIPAINQHAQEVKTNISKLKNITIELETKRETLIASAESLKSQQSEIAKLVAEREQIYMKTHKDIKSREAEVERISLQAKSLEDLIQKLEDESIKEEQRRKQKEEQLKKEEEERQKIAALVPPPETKKKESVAPKLEFDEQAQLPISGIIRVRYKEKDDLGALSEGITIEGRAGSLVVSPLSGKIQFAGAFKRYGNLIIIEHSGGYHSLIAGLEKINAVVGQKVSAGEPLGLLPATGKEIRPRVYYELRHKGKPVNPSVKFSDLG